jgi:hypothetical protein
MGRQRQRQSLPSVNDIPPLTPIHSLGHSRRTFHAFLVLRSSSFSCKLDFGSSLPLVELALRDFCSPTTHRPQESPPNDEHAPLDSLSSHLGSAGDRIRKGSHARWLAALTVGLALTWPATVPASTVRQFDLAGLASAGPYLPRHGHRGSRRIHQRRRNSADRHLSPPGPGDAGRQGGGICPVHFGGADEERRRG